MSRYYNYVDLYFIFQHFDQELSPAYERLLAQPKQTKALKNGHLIAPRPLLLPPLPPSPSVIKWRRVITERHMRATMFAPPYLEPSSKPSCVASKPLAVSQGTALPTATRRCHICSSLHAVTHCKYWPANESLGSGRTNSVSQYSISNHTYWALTERFIYVTKLWGRADNFTSPIFFNDDWLS